MDEFSVEKLSLPTSDEVLSVHDISDEVGRILAIIKRTYDPNFADDWEDMDFDDLIDLLEQFDSQHCFVVRDEEGGIHAAASVRPEPAQGQLWLESIAVAKESQGLRLSDLLIDPPQKLCPSTVTEANWFNGNAIRCQGTQTLGIS